MNVGEQSDIVSDVLTILENYKPSQLDEIVTIPCPLFEPRNEEITSAYRMLHNMISTRIISRLKNKFPELEFRCEPIVGSIKIDCEISNGKSELLLEFKTGSVKIVQPSVYAILSGKKVLVVEVKTGNVISLDISVAEAVVEELLNHMRERNELRNKGLKIRGEFCRRCCCDCEYKGEDYSQEYNPLRYVHRILKNLDVVVKKLSKEISREMMTD
jgi:hypothetical protein